MTIGNMTGRRAYSQIRRIVLLILVVFPMYRKLDKFFNRLCESHGIHCLTNNGRGKTHRRHLRCFFYNPTSRP